MYTDDGYNDPLIAPPPRRSFYRRYRTLLLFLAAVVIIGGGFVTLLVFSRPGRDESKAAFPPIAANPFTVQTVFNTSLRPSYQSLAWSVANDDTYYEAALGAIDEVYINGSRVTVISADTLKSNGLASASYTVSPDGRFFLFTSNRSSLYRHSATAIYTLIDTNSITPAPVLLSSHPIQYAVFSPNSSHVAYVQMNNIYLFDIASATSRQLTTTGAVNRIIHGVCDWAYEEEIWSRSGVIFFSPNSSALAFLSFNESNVQQYSFSFYYLPNNRDFVYKYPKSGQSNSVVSVGVLSLSSVNNSVQYVTKLIPTDDEQYITDVVWFTEQQLTVKVIPRIQNQSTLYSFTSADWAEEDPNMVAARLLIESHPYYLESHFVLQYIPTIPAFIDIVVANDADQLALFDPQSGNLLRLLTNTVSQDVRSVYCYNAATDMLFYTTNAPRDISQSLYAVNLLGTPTPRAVVATTSDLTWQDASFSSKCNFFTLNERANELTTTLYDASSSTIKAIRQLKNNTNVLSRLAAFAQPTPVYTTIPSAVVPSLSLNAYFLLPPTFEGTIDTCQSDTRYPVIVYVYGGPGNSVINSQYKIVSGWQTFLSTSYNFIIFVVDPIGTGNKGDTFRKNFTTFHLGIAEEVDVINAVAWLKQKCFVDTANIAYWGHSYGGLMAARIATNPLANGLVNTVISSAPVTDWRLYDTIYTERYMRTPQDNTAGYDATSLVTSNRSTAVHVKHFMLIHGTADDNVHFQNSALFAEALIANRVQFQSFYYPNRAHGLSSPHYNDLLTTVFVSMLNETRVEAILERPDCQ